MGIVYHKESETFHIFNDQISYLMCILPGRSIGQLYYGARICDREDFSHLMELGHRDMAPCLTHGADTTISLEHLKQEYPSFGKGDMRYPAFEICQENGRRISEFRYKEHRIFRGKRKPEGLPATYVESEDEAETLEIYLEDENLDMEICLSYTIFLHFPVITRNVRFSNGYTHRNVLTKVMSLSLDLPDSDYEMFTLTGASLRERYPARRQLSYGVSSIHSMRGHSSHQFNPFFALVRPDTTEEYGEVIGISLIYSGNFLGQAEVDTMDTTRAMIGIHPQQFAWTLGHGESFQAPEAVLVYTKDGLGSMSRELHKLYRTRLARGKWRDAERPVLVNNWEATYMNFDENKILDIAAKAKALGIELMVLDDGWFGKRNDDSTSLGDWFVNEEKLPSGIGGLSRKVTDLGMMFGIWIEPEMVSPESELFREHPDWILGDPSKHLCHGRHQLVLDFSKPEVVKHIGDMISEIIEESRISYIKWDMNRSISDLFSNGNDAEYQGRVYHRQILGIYALYERLTQSYPDILFESCASGGGRFDPGMLYYAPQAWASDCTDASERIRIQYGSSYVYPLSSIGSHVSAVPNHQTFRSLPIDTRAAVACFGAFGYELDLNLLTEEEQEAVKRQVEFVKKYRSLIHKGNFYRLISPFEQKNTLSDAAWMVVSEDQKKAVVAYFRMQQPVNIGYKRLKLQGLREGMEYRITGMNYTCYGDELMKVGLILSDYANGIRSVGQRDRPDVQTDMQNWCNSDVQGDGKARIFILESV